MKKTHLLPTTPSLLHFTRWAFAPFKPWVAFAITCSFITGLHATVMSYGVKMLVAAANTQPFNLNAMLYGIAILIGIHQIHLFTWRGFLLARKHTAQKLRERIASQIFSRISQNSLSFFNTHLPGVTAGKINTLLTQFERVCYVPVAFFIRGATLLTLSFITTMLVHPPSAWAMIITCALFFGINRFFFKKINALGRTVAHKNALLTGRIVETTNNMFTVQSFTQEKAETSIIKKTALEAEEPFKKKESLLIIMQMLQGFCIAGLLLFITISFALGLKNNTATAADFTFCLTLSLYINDSMWNLMFQINDLIEGLSQCQDSLHFLIPPQALPNKNTTPSPQNITGQISLKNVSFHYPNQSSILNKVNLDIPAQQKVGIVGTSGGGKTTFLNLINRFFDPTEGEILIDGRPLQSYNLQDLRGHISLVPQNPLLFNRSIAENIAYGLNTPVLEDIVEAAKKAHAHDFIMALPQQYDTALGVNTKLSGGQSQRIAIARALLKNAPILILDEATSQLDSFVEAELQKDLDLFLQNKTALIAAHRLSTLQNMDRLLVFDKGRIVEDGTPAELLKQKSIFYALTRQQNAMLSSL